MNHLQLYWHQSNTGEISINFNNDSIKSFENTFINKNVITQTENNITNQFYKNNQQNNNFNFSTFNQNNNFAVRKTVNNF